MNPRVSIIINCFSRRQYVMDALRSAQEQLDPGIEYEIILIKNFHDHDIDSFAEDHGIINIFTTEVETGKWFEIAARNAKGDYIFFILISLL